MVSIALEELGHIPLVLGTIIDFCESILKNLSRATNVLDLSSAEARGPMNIHHPVDRAGEIDQSHGGIALICSRCNIPIA